VPAISKSITSTRLGNLMIVSTALRSPIAPIRTPFSSTIARRPESNQTIVRVFIRKVAARLRQLADLSRIIAKKQAVLAFLMAISTLPTRHRPYARMPLNQRLNHYGDTHLGPIFFDSRIAASIAFSLARMLHA